MASLRRLLLGSERHGYRAVLHALFVLAVSVSTFAAYALGIFRISGGVVFIPGDAALVGMMAAGVVGIARGGVVVAWLVTVAALLGFHADHAFLGLSYLSPVERVAYFLEPEGLLVAAVQGLALCLLPFALGTLVRWGIDVSRDGTFRGGTDP